MNDEILPCESLEDPTIVSKNPKQRMMLLEDVELATWLSSALSDEKVCDEFKKIINSWFDTFFDTSKDIQDKFDMLDKEKILSSIDLTDFPD